MNAENERLSNDEGKQFCDDVGLYRGGGFPDRGNASRGWRQRAGAVCPGRNAQSLDGPADHGGCPAGSGFLISDPQDHWHAEDCVRSDAGCGYHPGVLSGDGGFRGACAAAQGLWQRGHQRRLQRLFPVCGENRWQLSGDLAGRRRPGDAGDLGQRPSPSFCSSAM